MQYSHYLYELNNYVWLGYVLALLATYLLNIGNRSYYIGAIIVVISTLIMLAIEPIYVSFGKDYPWFVWNFWYFTWASIDILSALLIYKLHRKERQKFGFVSISCIITFVALCVVQSLRHLDMVVMGTNLMATSFKVLVNSFSIGFLVLLLHPAYCTIKHHFRKVMTP